MRLVKTIYFFHSQRTAAISDNQEIRGEFGIKVHFSSISIEFYINYSAEDIMSPETLILFEILDFNHQALLYKDTDIYDKDNLYRVAWGIFLSQKIILQDF